MEGESPEVHQRLERLESKLGEIHQTLSHLAEVKAFDRELSASLDEGRARDPGSSGPSRPGVWRRRRRSTASFRQSLRFGHFGPGSDASSSSSLPF